MARYVHDKSNTEYTTGMLIFTIIVLLIVGWVAAGAIAAIPAFFGAITAALWVWSVLGGLWTGSMLLGLVEYKGESRRIESRVSR